MESFIKTFSQVNIKDVPAVGGKNASLGEMFNQLSSNGIRIPDGFATTAFAYWTFLDFNNLWEPLQKLMQQKANKAGKYIGFCGQAPSDIPEMATFLVKHGINSISFNPDALLKGIENIQKAEKETLLHKLAEIVF